MVRKRLNKSYPVIGKKLGGRDHTTILYSYNKIKREIEKDKELKEEIKNMDDDIETLEMLDFFDDDSL